MVFVMPLKKWPSIAAPLVSGSTRPLFASTLVFPAPPRNRNQIDVPNPAMLGDSEVLGLCDLCGQISSFLPLLFLGVGFQVGVQQITISSELLFSLQLYRELKDSGYPYLRWIEVTKFRYRYLLCNPIK